VRLGVAVSPARQAGIPADARLSASKFVTISEEEMTLTAASRSAMLDELADVVTHFSLHTSDPGATGVSEVSGGSYARVSAVWGAATDFQVSASPAVFTVPAGTPRFVGFWSASSGGTFYGSAALASPSLQIAGSFTVPVIRVYLDAGDVAIATGVSSDELRLLLHDGGLLQAPPHVDPDTVAYSAFDTYDAEQGGWPMRLPATSASKALAVTLGSNKSAMWFGARADGTEVLWMDQTGRSDALISISNPGALLTSSTVWSLQGVCSFPLQAGSTRLFRGSSDGYLQVGATGVLSFFQGATPHTAASTLTALLGWESGDDLHWYVAVNGTALTVEVSLDGIAWTTAITATMAAAVDMASNSLLYVGLSSFVSANCFRGQWLSFRLRDGGVSDPIVANFVPTLFPAGNRSNAATAADEYGVTWTLTKPTAAATDEPRVVLPGARRFVLPGVSGEYVSTPDSAANSITGDLDVRVAVTNVRDYAAEQMLAAKYATTGDQRSWRFSIIDDKLRFRFSADGVGSSFRDSATGIEALGETVELRVAIDADTGAGDGAISFYYRTTPGLGEWVVLNTVAVAGGVSIFDGTAPIEVGSNRGGAADLLGADVLFAEVYDGIDGTLVERIDPADADPDAYTFVSATSGATVTVNHTTAAGYKATLAEEGDSLLLVDGVNDFARVIGDMSVMDFDPTVGLTLVADVRMHNTTLSYGVLVTNSDATNDGAVILRHDTNPRFYGRLDDGAAIASVGDNADNITYGTRVRAIAAFGSSDQEMYTNGVSRETATTAVAAEPAATLPIFGRREDGGVPLAFELHGFVVIKRRVSDSAAATITTEMGF
jgi:hypothetical protein